MGCRLLVPEFVGFSAFTGLTACWPGELKAGIIKLRLQVHGAFSWLSSKAQIATIIYGPAVRMWLKQRGWVFQVGCPVNQRPASSLPACGSDSQLRGRPADSFKSYLKGTTAVILTARSIVGRLLLLVLEQQELLSSAI